MVKYSTSSDTVTGTGLDRVFGALADPTRRAILARLAMGDASVTDLASPCDMSLPAVVKHLRVLADAGLVATEKTGRVRQCRLEPTPLRSAAEWLDHYQRFWTVQLDNLGSFLERATTRTTSKEHEWTPTPPRPHRPSKSRARTARRKRSSSRH